MRKMLLLLAVLVAGTRGPLLAQEQPAEHDMGTMQCDKKHEGNCPEHCAKMHHAHGAEQGTHDAPMMDGMQCHMADRKDMQECPEHCAKMHHEHAAEHSAEGGAHEGFMHHGMSHELQKGVKLEEKIDQTAHVITLREGPMNLPAHTGHHQAAQPPDQTWTVPFDGWLLGYTPRLVDAAGAALPGTLLHHTAFWNVNRSDFLCKNKEEHIYGAGSELNVWPAVPGYGYRVQKGDQIRIETMVYNPTAKDYPGVWLEVAIQFLPLPAAGEKAAAVRNVYPAWIDVQECGDSGYTLLEGQSTKTGVITLRYSGALLGVGGHLHDFGRQLLLRDAVTGKEIAKLDAKLDEQGHLLSTPIVTFYQTGGYPLKSGDKLEVTATYDNPMGQEIPDGAMGSPRSSSNRAAPESIRKRPA
ncbi:MAG: hypothetical protein LAN84_16655 [Acidobacteriia bacterium]|nr:hypothetical protein [Terriglobia bacterium]